MRIFNNIPIPSIIEFNEQKVVLTGVIRVDLLTSDAHLNQLVVKYRADDWVEGAQELTGFILFVQRIADVVILEETLHGNFKALESICA